MSEKIEVEVEPKTEYLACPGSVKSLLPKKIGQAVSFALDECFIEIVGEPSAQRDQWVYKEIKKRISALMMEWVKEAMDEAIAEAIGAIE